MNMVQLKMILLFFYLYLCAFPKFFLIKHLLLFWYLKHLKATLIVGFNTWVGFDTETLLVENNFKETRPSGQAAIIHKVKTFPLAKTECPRGIRDNNAHTLPQSSDKTGFRLESPDASTSALAKCQGAQSLDNTAEAWYSYTRIKKQSPAHNWTEQAFATARDSKEWRDKGPEA